MIKGSVYFRVESCLVRSSSLRFKLTEGFVCTCPHLQDREGYSSFWNVGCAARLEVVCISCLCSAISKCAFLNHIRTSISTKVYRPAHQYR